MRGADSKQEAMFSYVSPEARVPAKHPLRPIRAMIAEALAQIITAAVRLYYAKSELEDRPVPAIVQEGDETLTPTEMLVAVSEMLRDVRLGPMELGLWFRRRPGEAHLVAVLQPEATVRTHDEVGAVRCAHDVADDDLAPVQQLTR